MFPLSDFKFGCRLGFVVAFLSLSAAPNGFTQPTPSPAPTRSFPASSSPSPIPLDGWLISASLWQTTPDHFPEAQSLGFRWISDAHDAARAAGRGLRLGRVPVAEAIARFSTEKTQPAEP